MNNKQLKTYALGFLGITFFTVVLTQLPDSIHIFKSERSVMFVLLLTIIMVMLNEVKQARISSDSICNRIDKDLITDLTWVDRSPGVDENLLIEKSIQPIQKKIHQF